MNNLSKQHSHQLAKMVVDTNKETILNMKLFIDNIIQHIIIEIIDKQANIYPSINSGLKYNKKLDKYIDDNGLKFDYTIEMKIDDMINILKNDFTINKKAKCVLNNKYNNDEKSKSEIINSPNYEGKLIKFLNVDSKWYLDNSEIIYFITINSHIIKIGMSENNYDSRFSSYLCGTRRAMEKGTCSTTNFHCCEVCYVALLLGYNVDIYGFELKKEKKEISIYSKKAIVYSSIIRGYEDIITSIYKDINGKLPPLCGQHSNRYII